MPVIGRLDEQVNEVLINPLERGRGREPRPAADEPPPAPVESDEPPAGETSRAPDELPVWLL
jgi:hypothetical protein